MVELYVITEFYLPKLAAALSIMGSAIILGEVMQDMKRSRGASAVSRILLSMSIGDMIFSFGVFLGTWVSPPRPEGDEYFAGTTYGSHASCVFQGFILQFGGLASLFFNASLGMVYLLMVQRNWRESRIRTFITPLAIAIWVVCLGTSLVPIPLDMYHNVGPMCWIGDAYNCTRDSGEETVLLDDLFELEFITLPAEETTATVECVDESESTFVIFFLQILPVWGAIMCNLIIMCIIYTKVRTMEDAIEANRSSSFSTTARAPDLLSDRNLQLESSHNDDDEEDNGGAYNINNEGSNIEDSGVMSSYSGRTSTSYNNKTSRIVARQGMWYIAGFLLTYGFQTVAVVIFLVSGAWNPKLDRTSYFFVALQGLWNFLIFSRGRRHMKTTVGRRVRGWVWERNCWPCYCQCHCHWPSRSSSDEDISAPIKSKSSGRSRSRWTRSQQEEKRSITLPPIEEETDADCELQGKAGPWSGLLVGWRGWTNQVASQLVSELGASGFSSSGDSDFEPNDAPPSKPFRMRSEVESPPVKPERSESFRVEGKVPCARPEPSDRIRPTRSQESPPSRPERLISEVSDLGSSSTPEGVIAMDTPSSSSLGSGVRSLVRSLQSAETTPMRPTRYESEISELTTDVESISSLPTSTLSSSAAAPSTPSSTPSSPAISAETDAIASRHPAPSKPIRQPSSSALQPQQTHAAAPPKPVRQESDLADDDKQPYTRKALSRPISKASNMSSGSSWENEASLNKPARQRENTAASSPPTLPQRLQSEVDF